MVGKEKNFYRFPSNVHISTPSFQKTVFFFKMCFGNTTWKFLWVCLNFGIYVMMIPVDKFKKTCALKKLFLTGVEVTATLPNSDTYSRRIYLRKSFHSDMPNVDTFLFNKQNWSLSFNAFEYLYKLETTLIRNRLWQSKGLRFVFLKKPVSM